MGKLEDVWKENNSKEQREKIKRLKKANKGVSGSMTIPINKTNKSTIDVDKIHNHIKENKNKHISLIGKLKHLLRSKKGRK